MDLYSAPSHGPERRDRGRIAENDVKGILNDLVSQDLL